MLAVLTVTVVGRPLIALWVIVKTAFAVPEFFSRMETSLIESVGMASSLLMVPRPWASTMVPLDRL